ncbi:hypothetical protein NQ317_019944 [Molorchus minor]|uniref:Transposase domain-containing protein n=1 Tax=Molorchus minor TaxID=1323400 RepID=A0ABQ9JAH3_9CUCU|nr:hypothetical protein NQ317_019944 [Molorchus minor]
MVNKSTYQRWCLKYLSGDSSSSPESRTSEFTDSDVENQRQETIIVEDPGQETIVEDPGPSCSDHIMKILGEDPLAVSSPMILQRRTTRLSLLLGETKDGRENSEKYQFTADKIYNLDESGNTSVHMPATIDMTTNSSASKVLSFDSSLFSINNKSDETVLNPPNNIRDNRVQVPHQSPELKNNSSLQDNLCLWASESSVSHRDFIKLLQILRQHGHEDNLTKDSCTLLKTPRDNKTIIEMGSDKLPNQILLNINIDGLPLAKSSGSQFWPILGCIVEEFNTEPFNIGVYHGHHKPADPNQLLHCFVDEMKSLKSTGLLFDKKIIIHLNAIICDSPARAFIACIKGHNAYFGCSICIQEGEYIDRRVTYPEVNAHLRTDESFKQKTQEEHHKEGLTSSDEKNATILVKRAKNIRMQKEHINDVSCKLQLLKPHIAKEFCRKPRTLEEIDRFKATELRQILLYTGPVVLKNNLTKKQYAHFLCFSIAMRILCDEMHSNLIEYAKSLLVHFVKNYSKLYGDFSVSYNVHNLIHLPADVKKFGPLDKFSAFKYENFMQQIVQKVKCSNLQLEQLCSRIAEESNIEIVGDKKN